MIRLLSPAIVITLLTQDVNAFSLSAKSTTSLHAMHEGSDNNNNNNNNNINNNNNNSQINKRREFLYKSLSLGSFIVGSSSPAYAVERAVGSYEKSCRAQGNCLEKFDIDGAVGWNWGGKDRCDATDPRCGADGTLRDAPPSGQQVPEPINDEGNVLQVTDVIQIDMSIGKVEKGTLTIGLYGNACPNSVAQMMDFLSDNIYSGGLLTTSKLMLEDGLGVQATPVSLIKGGNLQTIYPNSRLDFGISSQAIAYAKSKNLSKAPEGFVAQPRPSKQGIIEEKSTRSHKVSGLISIPQSGLGYGGNGLESEDEAFASAFEITANSVPAMDKESRKVVGQLMDVESMDFLARLASLPTQKGLKGVIPGQNAGRPLIKVAVLSVSAPRKIDPAP